MLCPRLFINLVSLDLEPHPARHRHFYTLESLRSLAVNTLGPAIDNIIPMSRTSSTGKDPLYPLICYSFAQDKILLPHTKTIEETIKLLQYYLDMPKNQDIELTTKWNGHNDRVRLVAHVWPYIAGSVDEIKVVTYEKGPLSP